MKSPKSILFIITTSFLLCFKSFAQCPSVADTVQTFCDLDSLLISDLQATDEGAGVAWFETPSSTVPLNGSESLINGQTYYLDNAAGTCGTREVVLVNILGPPTGLNFQGVCVENALEATLEDLEAFGNDVQWYLTPSGGTALNITTVLTDNTIYYADQSSPFTGCRTSRLSVFVNVGIVDVPVGDSLQEFCVIDGNTPTVGDLVASGINNWYLSFSSASPLDLSTPLIDGQTYFATSLDPPCESDNRLAVTVNLIQQVNPGEDGTLDLCQDDTTSVDLFDSLGGTPDPGGTWSPALASGSGIFDPNLDPAGVYTYTVTSPNPICPDDTATVTVTFIPPPLAGEDGTLDLCQDDTTSVDLFDSLGGTPDPGGTWSPALASGSGIFDPNIDPAGVYTYTVTSPNPICPDDTATVTVTFIPPPLAGEDGTLDLCQDDTTSVDLFDSLGGTPDPGGTWSPALASGSGIFDPNLDPAGVYTYTVTSPNPICPDDTATVTVTFIPPPLAGEDGTLDLCQDDTTSVDLFDSLGGTPDPGGTWSPALASGSGIFDPNLDSAGVYTYTVTSPNPICPDDTATVTVTFIPPPLAGEDGTLDLCQDDTTSVDLFDSLGGTPDPGGTWSPALASGSGIFDPNLDPAGVYTYTVTSPNPICPDDTATVTVTFIPPPLAGEDGTLDLCQDDTTSVDLFDSLGGTPDPGGTWSPALASGSGIFDPNLDPAGVYTYTVTSPNPICPDDTATVTVTFIPPPLAGEDGTLDLCQDDTTSVDLFDSLGGTPDPGGTWSPALASGSGIFDPNLDPAGVYTYTVTSPNPICPDDTATVTVTFIPPPLAGEDGTLDLCQDDTTSVDLFDSLGGTPDPGGTWSPALASGSGIFDPNLDPAGVYTYTVTSPNPICPDDTATVTVTFIPPPLAGEDGTLDLCQDDTTSVDLFDSLGGTPDPGGTWSPALASGSGIFDPNLDPAGVYTYTVTSPNPICPDDTATVTVTFIPPPLAGEDGTLDLCQDDTTSVDLFDSLGGTPDPGGTWSPALASGSGIFDPNLDSAGVYTYTVTSPNPICPDDTATVTVTFIPPPLAGEDGTLDLCQDDTTSVDLFDSLGGTPDPGGTWSPALASGSGIFDPNLDPAGVYTYTVTSPNPICPDDTATVTVTFIPPPLAGEDGTLDLCQDDTTSVDLFDSLGGTPDPGGTWSPALASGSGIFDPNLDPAGVYTYTVNQPECNLSDSAEVMVSFIENPNVSGLEINILNICSGQDLDISLSNMILLLDDNYSISYSITGPDSFSGMINLIVTNGNANFTISNNSLENPGIYEFNITAFLNANSNCPADLSTILPSSFEVFETITPEILVDENFFCPSDNATIQDLSNNITSSGTIEWYSAPIGGTLLNVDDILIDGESYFASITTDNGCVSIERLEVIANIGPCEEDLIIPDGFSPNGDTINDTFLIRNLEELYPNFKLTIYNRNGNKLYEGDINSPLWNGTTTTSRIGGGIVPVGVYFYILEFNDGIKEAVQGRVYLSR